VSAWEWSGAIGIVLGVVSFGFTFLLIIGLQYRRYGRFTGLRLLGAAAVNIYLTTLIAYTLLPLPSSREAVCAPILQLVPFHFVRDIATDTAGDGVMATLTSQAVLQVVFNVLLFVPFGVIVRGFFSRGLLATVAAGFAASVIIEVTQYTADWGLYSCPYRVADIDDVLTNTVGAMVGALLGPVMLGWMPRQRQLLAHRAAPRPVTVRRRWLGMAIDLALFGALSFIITLPYSLLWILTTGAVAESPDVIGATLGTLVPAIIVFIVPAVRGTGASIGQSAVWLAPQWRSGPSLGRRVARAVSVGGSYGVLVFVSQLSLPVSGAAAFLSILLLVVNLAAVPLTRDAAGLSGLLTGAVMRDERTLQRKGDDVA
jgi:glycopeptide antibiotics resistance protein